jgi:hypothetical protein
MSVLFIQGNLGPDGARGSMGDIGEQVSFDNCINKQQNINFHPLL